MNPVAKEGKSTKSTTKSPSNKHKQQKTLSFLPDGTQMAFLVAVAIALCLGKWGKIDVELSKQMSKLIDPLPPKYESEVVSMSWQRLLQESDACSIQPQVVSDLVHVLEAMNRTESLRTSDRVFLMLNGQNEGIFLSWNKEKQGNCLHSLAKVGAIALGADDELTENGLKLFTQLGDPVTDANELDQDAGRIVHVLLDGQIWVWPGIKIGYVYHTDGVIMTTVSLKPKVLNVKNFFTADEADSIIEMGKDKLERSPVDSAYADNGISDDRTSFTAFLQDNAFTRDFRMRSARVARLPSPSFAERLQLVRYQTGQYFRKHEDYFASKVFLPPSDGWKQYIEWANKAAEKIRALGTAAPEGFRVGEALFPNGQDNATFQWNLLNAFLEETSKTDYWNFGDMEWKSWIEENVKNGAHGILGTLLESKGYMLPEIIKSWEKRAGIKDLSMSLPKRPPNGVTHYFRWIRWLKEKISEFGHNVPKGCSASGDYYPKYEKKFQKKMMRLVLDNHNEEDLLKIVSREKLDAAKKVLESDKDADVYLDILRETSAFVAILANEWSKKCSGLFAYTLPKQLKHFEPQRFVTLFLYLNSVEGGETVFPYSKERIITGIERKGMEECSEGLAVPAIKTEASLFYAQTPLNDVDPSSLHGGCPPAEGTKWGSNSFMWNADAEEGANAWDL